MAVAGPPRGGPPRRRPSRGDGRAGSPRSRRRPRRGAAVRRPPAPVRDPRRVHARPPRRRGAVRDSGSARDEWAKPPTALSGGEQTRATLARLVIAQPDLLLLDEPTNHLDIGAIEWLEEHLRRRHGALLVASHDRAFLDATVAASGSFAIGASPSSGATTPPTTGSARSATRGRRRTPTRQADSIEREKRARPALPVAPEVQQDARARGPARAAPGRTGRDAEARRERFAFRPARSPAAVRAVPARSWSGLEALVVGYLPGRGAMDPDGRPATEPRRVATAPFLAAQRGDRIGIVGPNGAGKTTLLRTIAGDLPPLDGSLTFGNAVQPGYLAQLRGAAIPGATVLDALLEAIPVTPGEARGVPGPVPVPRRGRVQGGPVALGRRAIASRARAARDPALEPAPARRADEPPRHPGARGDRDVHGRVAGDAARRVPRPAAARDRLLHALGRRRRAGRAVRRRLEGVAGGRRRRLDGPRARPSARRQRLRGARRAAVGRDGRRPDETAPARRRSPAAGATRRRRSGAGTARAAAGRARSCRRTPTGARRPRSMPS